MTANNRNISGQQVSRAVPFKLFSSTFVLALLASGGTFPDTVVKIGLGEFDFDVLLSGQQLWTRFLATSLLGILVRSSFVDNAVTFWSGVFVLGLAFVRLWGLPFELVEWSREDILCLEFGCWFVAGRCFWTFFDFVEYLASWLISTTLSLALFCRVAINLLLR